MEKGERVDAEESTFPAAGNGGGEKENSIRWEKGEEGRKVFSNSWRTEKKKEEMEIGGLFVARSLAAGGRKCAPFVFFLCLRTGKGEMGGRGGGLFPFLTAAAGIPKERGEKKKKGRGGPILFGRSKKKKSILLLRFIVWKKRKEFL